MRTNTDLKTGSRPDHSPLSRRSIMRIMLVGFADNIMPHYRMTLGLGHRADRLAVASPVSLTGGGQDRRGKPDSSAYSRQKGRGRSGRSPDRDGSLYGRGSVRVSCDGTGSITDDLYASSSTSAAPSRDHRNWEFLASLEGLAAAFRNVRNGLAIKQLWGKIWSTKKETRPQSNVSSLDLLINEPESAFKSYTPTSPRRARGKPDRNVR